MSRLSMRKIKEIFRQYHNKRSYRNIAQSLNVSISTISDYLSRAKKIGLEWPFPDDISEEEIYNKLFNGCSNQSKTRPLPEWEDVHRELRKKGVTLQLLWREYKDIYSDGLGYTQFCTRYRHYVKSVSPVMRQKHKAGEKTFVDYAGMKMPWVNPITGELHEAEIFVGSLGASQYTFVEATATQQLPDWIQSHIRMWAYFGGISEIVVPDNLRAGVTKAHRYDPDINANYQHLSEHYGFAIVPARAAEPKDKAKVENAVGWVERQILAPLRHRTFTSLSEINAAIKPLLDKINRQSFQKMKTSRWELFETVDKPALKPLPSAPYQYVEWSKAKIHIDYHFVFKDHFYSVPYNYIHREVDLCTTGTTVECFYQGKRIAVHARSHSRYQFTTLTEHMPANHLAQAEWSPDRMRRWAKKIGAETAAFIEHMILSRPFPHQAMRSCLGLLRMGKRFGDARLEKACSIALAAGATRYQQVESILKNKIDQLESQSEIQGNVVSIHHNIRGSNYYK
ncbi:TPA: IS21 family transposase [Legionella pneumophila]|nr:IS21 family transposase [Legionella pneumophila]